jgi:hypothetical protein
MRPAGERFGPYGVVHFSLSVDLLILQASNVIVWSLSAELQLATASIVVQPFRMARVT